MEIPVSVLRIQSHLIHDFDNHFLAGLPIGVAVNSQPLPDDLTCDMNSLFENGIRKNLRLCAVTSSIQICTRAGFHTSIVLQQPTTEIQITDNCRIAKEAFFSKRSEMLEFY